MFKPVPNTDFVKQEEEILESWLGENHDEVSSNNRLSWDDPEMHNALRWNKSHVFYTLKNEREKKNRGPWSFVDGPITANNPMGVHHAWGRTYKDLFQRFKAMQGYELRYQNGFDCQGLWIEVNVERESETGWSKGKIEANVEKFINECKCHVLRYAAWQTEQSIRLGYWMDWNDPDLLRKLETEMAQNPSQTLTVEGSNGPVTDTVKQLVGRLGSPELGGSYFTFSDENNYTIWAMLKKCFDRGWIYKGTDVMPWCPRCDTGISQHEIVTDGYRELTHTSIFLRFPLPNRSGESLLVWTTTPWTLTSNVAAAVHPDLTYVLVEQGEHRFWLSKGALENAIQGNYDDDDILDEKSGRELEGWTYEGPFDELPAVEKTFQKPSGEVEEHRVILWDKVDEAEGTGIVHIAPGCGAEDFELSKEHGLPVIAPLGEEGKYLDGFGWLSDLQVHNEEDNVAERIFEDLKQKVYRLKDYTHRYPVCWRCEEELVFRLVDEWFISMDGPRDEQVEDEEKLRYQMMEVLQNEPEPKWYPSFGLARELDWLRNMHDWMISKKRYWGLALPIYECDECSNFHVVGSREELEKLVHEDSRDEWEEFKSKGHTPHRPWIDAVKIACPSCGAAVSRIPDVGNPWLDAGIVSFSTMQYNTDYNYWDKWFPADLISESFPGQFRNWFYSLIAMSTVMERRAPFEHNFSYATLFAEDGREMHKSWGNAIWFDEAAEMMGVDVMRWMYCAAKPEQNLLFGYTRSHEVRRQVLLPFWNVYSFLVTYANLDGWEPTPNLWKKTPQGSENPLDDWILIRLQSTVLSVTDRLEAYSPDGACRVVEDFLDDLSNWYLRRSRRRFWKSEADPDKEAAYQTLYHVMVTTSRLLAPFMPFVTESIFRNLVCSIKDSDAPKSVHLSDYPIAEELEDDMIEREDDMRLVRDLIGLGRAARNQSGIKTRQPIGRIAIGGISEKGQAAVKDLSALVLDELNVKDREISFYEGIDEFVTYTIKPNFKLLGPKYGKNVQSIAKAMSVADVLTLKQELDDNGELEIQAAGVNYTLERAEVDVQSEKREGYAVEADAHKFVALSTELTHDLILEGFARELVNKIQQIRKEADFNVSDRISLSLESTPIVHEAFERHQDYITHETLTLHVIESSSPDAFLKSQKVNGEDATIGVERVK